MMARQSSIADFPEPLSPMMMLTCSWKLRAKWSMPRKLLSSSFLILSMGLFYDAFDDYL